jgi:hypothetical protein
MDIAAMNSPAKNALRLKMAGLIFGWTGLVAVMVLGDKMGDFEKPLAAAPRDYVFIAGAWLVAAHFVAVGLIVLLAGLKDVPLLTSARARRGALQKLAGSTLIILCFAIVGLMDLPAFKPLFELWWAELTGLALVLITAHVGFRLLRSGWKYDVVSAEQLLASDPRLPVIYLRSFEADSEIVLRRDGLWNKVANILFGYWVTFSPEQELAEIVTRVGPVIAIGKPGEPLPELGAARLYVGDADWKAKVIDLMARSRLVIIRTGPTPNLEWDRTGDDARAAPADSICEPRGCRKDRGFRPVLQTALWPGASIRHYSGDATLVKADVHGQTHGQLCNRQDHLL